MPCFSTRSFALLASLIVHSLSAPVVIVHPGDATNGLQVTKHNTLNATASSNSTAGGSKLIRDTVVNATASVSNVTRIAVDNTLNATNLRIDVAGSATSGQLPLALVNNFSGGSINGYVTGLDSNNELVMLQPDGTFYRPTAPTTGIPQLVEQPCAIPLGAQGSTTQVTIPDYISASRIWFAEGELDFFTVQAGSVPSLVEPSAVNPNDPSAAVNWGFVELTNVPNYGLYADISYVDFLGLDLGMELASGDGSTQAAKGLQPNSVQSVCNDLAAQAAIDGAPWDDLCQADSAGNVLRVIAPSDYLSNNPSAFATYWDDYVNQVWSTYASTPLVIDTQNSPGSVSCTVQGDELQCAGDNRGYARPTAADIFGCNSGPFAVLPGDNLVHTSVVPRLCAAFARTTLLLPGGNVQPGLDASQYYTVAPSNFYSKFIHRYEMDGKGYAFPYDDVTPDGGINQSGVVADSDPQLLTIYVGGDTS